MKPNSTLAHFDPPADESQISIRFDAVRGFIELMMNAYLDNPLASQMIAEAYEDIKALAMDADHYRAAYASALAVAQEMEAQRDHILDKMSGDLRAAEHFAIQRHLSDLAIELDMSPTELERVFDVLNDETAFPVSRFTLRGVKEAIIELSEEITEALACDDDEQEDDDEL